MNNELKHYGVKGMRWGVRRYQNEDGSLTSAGKKRIKKGLKRRTSHENEHALKNKMFDAESKDPEVKKAENRYNEAWYKKERAKEAMYESDRKYAAKRQKADQEHNKEQQRLGSKVDAAYMELDKAERAYIKAGEDFFNSWKSDIAGARLKDIGVEDTAAGRQYILDNYKVFNGSDWRREPY